ncbi:hypothetical protein GCM10027562_15120 [Arthrobacter pigmenti]
MALKRIKSRGQPGLGRGRSGLQFLQCPYAVNGFALRAGIHMAETLDPCAYDKGRLVAFHPFGRVRRWFPRRHAAIDGSCDGVTMRGNRFWEGDHAPNATGKTTEKEGQQRLCG